ncbi:MAG: hypothetical protein ASARMPREDX12_001209 [Alectoria sarmentosa]|nr:MAG: hypothetical protein ASARMPREDX12_001209 [Alectoria sarmentosa]
MDTFTTACLALTMPAKGSLQSIGSFRAMHERANAETADNSDFGKFGQEADDEYIRDVAAQRQSEKSEAAKRLPRRSARLAAMRRFVDVHTKVERKLSTLITNATSKVAQRHVAT